MTNISPLVTCDRARQYLLAAPADEARPVGIEQHLQSCPSCRNVALTLASLDGVVRRAHLSEVSPVGLWDRVARTLDAEDCRAAATKGTLSAVRKVIAKTLEQARYINMTPWRGAAVGLAAIVLAIVVTIVADPLALRAERQSSALVREPVNDLITYRVSRRPLDFENGDPRTISEWWADKLDFHPPAPVAEIDGYRLIGGRLCYFLSRRLSALMYRKGEHVLSLYIMSADQLELPGGGYEQTDSWKVSVHEHKGYTSLIWEEGSLVFALVGDLSSKELLRAANDLRRGWDHDRETRALRHGGFAMVNESVVTAYAEDGVR
jgi:anti-sigma factor RsiW